jgi:ABC-type multidrug transport system ATPase subunit
LRKNRLLLTGSPLYLVVLLLFPTFFACYRAFLPIGLSSIIDNSTPAPLAVPAIPTCAVFAASDSEFGKGAQIPNAACVNLVYAPNCPAADAIVAEIAASHGWSLPSDVLALEDADALYDLATDPDRRGYVSFGLAFDFEPDATFDELPAVVSYEILYNSTVMMLSSYMNVGDDPLGAAANGLASGVVLAVQHAVEKAVITLRHPGAVYEPLIQPFPIVFDSLPPGYVAPSMASSSNLWLFPAFATLICSTALVSSEKAAGRTASLRLLGTAEFLLHFSWFLSLGTVAALSPLPAVAILRGFSVQTLPWVDFWPAYVTFAISNLTMVAFALTVSAVCGSIRQALVVAAIASLLGVVAARLIAFTGDPGLLYDPSIIPGLPASLLGNWADEFEQRNRVASYLLTGLRLVLPPCDVISIAATLFIASEPSVYDTDRVTGEVVIEPPLSGNLTWDVMLDPHADYMAPLTDLVFTFSRYHNKPAPPQPVPAFLKYSVWPLSAQLSHAAAATCAHLFFAFWICTVRSVDASPGYSLLFPLMPSFYSAWPSKRSLRRHARKPTSPEDVLSSIAAAEAALAANEGKVAGAPNWTSLDAAVKAEMTSSLAAPDDSETAIVLTSFTKTYGSGSKSVKAVRGLSFRVTKGEIFGFLGSNSSGKSSTLNSLVGVVPRLSNPGNAWVLGLSVKHHVYAIRRISSMCPQLDETLWPALSPDQHLRLVIGLRNMFHAVPRRERAAAVEQEIIRVLSGVGLLSVRHQPCVEFSGGMRRRLCLATALCGSPPIIWTDEASSGVDVHSQRVMWRAMQHAVQQHGTTLFMTSHSMEEAEQLAAKVAILSHGQLEAYGAVQQLQSRFGAGYLFSVVGNGSCGETTPRLIADAVLELVEPLARTGVAVLDISGQTVLFSISPEAFPALPGLLRMVQSASRQATVAISPCLTDAKAVAPPSHDLSALVSDFSVSQSSLVEVFLRITAHADSAVAASPSVSTRTKPRRWFRRSLSPPSSPSIDNISSEGLQEVLKAPCDKPRVFAGLVLRNLYLRRAPSGLLSLFIIPAMALGLLWLFSAVLFPALDSLLNTLDGMKIDYFTEHCNYCQAVGNTCFGQQELGLLRDCSQLAEYQGAEIVPTAVPVGETNFIRDSRFAFWSIHIIDETQQHGTWPLPEVAGPILATDRRMARNGQVTRAADSVALAAATQSWFQTAGVQLSQTLNAASPTPFSPGLVRQWPLTYSTFDTCSAPFDYCSDFLCVRRDAQCISACVAEKVASGECNLAARYEAYPQSCLRPSPHASLDEVSQSIMGSQRAYYTPFDYSGTPEAYAYPIVHQELASMYPLAVVHIPASNTLDSGLFTPTVLLPVPSAPGDLHLVRLGAIVLYQQGPFYEPPVLPDFVEVVDWGIDIAPEGAFIDFQRPEPRFPGSDNEDLLDVRSSAVTYAARVEQELATAVLRSLTGTSASGFEARTRGLPYVRDGTFLDTLFAFDKLEAVFASIMLPLAVSSLYPYFLSLPAAEKENRMRALLQLQGVRPAKYWSSLLVFNVLVSLAVSLFIVRLGVWLDLKQFVRSDWTLLWLFFATHTVAASLLSCLIPCFLETVRGCVLVAAACLLLFSAALPLVIVLDASPTEDGNNAIQNFFPETWHYLFPPAALSNGSRLIADRSLQWSRPDPQLMASLATTAGVCIVIFCAIVYLDAVLPRRWGVSDRPLDPLRMAYSAVRRLLRQPPVVTETLPQPSVALLHNPQLVASPSVPSNSPSMVPEQLPADPIVLAERQAIASRSFDPMCPVQMYNLHKRYSNGKCAVQDVALTVRPGECMCLLGANGSGKTSTISMLTGVIEPTGGTARVAGHLITGDLTAVQRREGLVFQHDVTWPSLTVTQHLRIMASLRGVRRDVLRRTVEDLIDLTGLRPMANRPAAALSGGMRRCLSLCMALVGGPPVEIMDEVTTGLSPALSRRMWRIVAAATQGRACVLVTHHLEEAEALANRVAIMAAGTVRCLGTKLELARRYGEGYSVFALPAKGTSVAHLTNRLKQVAPSLLLARFDASGCYFSAGQDVDVAALFEFLLTAQTSKMLHHFAVSHTDLATVFLRIAREAEEEAAKDAMVA